MKCAEADDLVRPMRGAVNNATMRARALAHGHRRVPQIAASFFDELTSIETRGLGSLPGAFRWIERTVQRS